MAKAAELRGERRKVVAVIGDGSMTEASPSRGSQQRRSLARHRPAGDPQRQQHGDRPSDGALKSCLLKLSTSKHYNRFKQSLWRTAPPCAPRAAPLPEGVERSGSRGFLNNSEPLREPRLPLFPGPIDGHNLPSWCARCAHCARSKARSSSPRHDHQRRGYLPAEHDQPTWHARGAFDTGERIAAKGATARYQDVFGRTLVEAGSRADARVVGVTPAPCPRAAR